MGHFATVLLLLTFFCAAFGQDETATGTHNGILIGTAIVAVVAVVANIIQFIVNMGLLIELRRSRPTPGSTSKSGPSNFSRKSHSIDSKPRSQSVKSTSSEAAARKEASDDVKTVSCIAYGKFAATEQHRETNIDGGDYAGVRCVP